MPYYKTQTGGVHFLDSEKFEHYLPAGSTRITDAEALVLLPQPEVPPILPIVVSRFQALAALMQMGFLGDIQAYMALPETDPFTVLAWEEAQEFREDSPTILALQPVLGLTEPNITDLFRFARSVSA